VTGAPVSTYRLQLHADFDFAAARAVVPYLADLGVDWCYLAPAFTSRPGSRHGYDVVDPTAVNPELGGRSGLEAFTGAAHAAGLGVLLDIVPNHQAVTTRNPRWYALLREGRESVTAPWFDIDWSGNELVAPDKVLWAFLGREPAAELAAGTLYATDGQLHSFDEVLPLRDVDGTDLALPEALAAALERQPYQLAQWRRGRRFINYRRFFDVSELIGVRVEDPEVFAASHALAFELLHDGVVDGLRVDHVDGLADPAAYLERVAAEVPHHPVYVEKILAADEPLDPVWPVAGTTGYETTNALTALLVDPDGRARLEAALHVENGDAGFATIATAAKRTVLQDLFAPEWARVRKALDEAASAAGLTIDAGLLADALAEITVALDVYRTYCGDAPATDADRARLDRAAARATDERVADPAALRAVRAVLAGDDLPPTAAPARAALVVRWQQLSGAVMAKGHEDTAEYRYPALLAQAEVGGDPADDCRTAVARFHAQQAARVASGRAGLTATTTHDTKRSEDTRARVAVLSERADAFAAGLARWTGAVDVPAGVQPVELRFVAQTLLGAWPLDGRDLDTFEERIAAYVVKALREAKQATTWLDPDEAHEAAVVDIARRTIAGGGRVLHDAFGDLVDDIAWYGAINGLAQLTWKLGAPGAADIYQGTELWDLSLVDPDNRRPVDYDARVAMLARSGDDWRSGAVKLHMTAAGLRARRDQRALFARGAYLPLAVADDAAVAFARRHESLWAIACAPRLSTRLAPRDHWPVGADVWGDRTIVLPADAPARWSDVFTGTEIEATAGALPVGTVLERLPGALLVSR
jgi:malto-oligosyltrehalose synthase